MDKTDVDNYDYWQRREPAKVEGFVSREDYQAHRRLKRLQAVEAAKEAGEYDRFVALGWCSRKDLAEKQAHSHRKVFTEVTILPVNRSEEHTSELQSLMRISYAVFCLNTKNKTTNSTT